MPWKNIFQPSISKRQVMDHSNWDLHTSYEVNYNHLYKLCTNVVCKSTVTNMEVVIIIILLHGLGRLTCTGIDALPSFPGASTISFSSRFVVEGMFRQSGVVHSFKMVDPVLFVRVFESHVLYSRDL